MRPSGVKDYSVSIGDLILIEWGTSASQTTHTATNLELITNWGSDNMYSSLYRATATTVSIGKSGNTYQAFIIAL